MSKSLPCENGAGSLNNPNNQVNTGLTPYTPKDVCVGTWEITSTNPDLCAQNEAALQESYIAETLNISGAPINIYKLLGVHEQGKGSLLEDGKLITSPSYPGFPNTGINLTSWRSLSTGSSVVNSAFVGVDFGIKLMPSSNISEYEKPANKWTDIGSISLTQSNVPGYWAQQVRVDIADGSVVAGTPLLSGDGNGSLQIIEIGSDACQSTISAVAVTPTTFNCFVTFADNSVLALGQAVVGEPFYSTIISFVIHESSTPFSGGDLFTIYLEYEWKRVAIFNLLQTNSAQTLNLQQKFKVRAVRVVPTMFTGAGSWEVLSFDLSDTVPTDINNIQDLFFNENRDRDYSPTPVTIKMQFTPADSITDLSKFGVSILDQYTFTLSFATMVNALGRPIVTGDIIEVTPEMQYDHNLKPVRKFLEVTDTGWSSGGFSPAYRPMVYRFNAQQALPSQETRDIFGTLDTQKYLIPDEVLADSVVEQLNAQPLTNTEEILKDAFDDVPEVGSNDVRTVQGVPARVALPPVNEKGNPAPLPAPNPKSKPNVYIEAGLPPNNEPYGEGFKLPEATDSTDGQYFRLYYPPETKIPARLYRFSAVKNRWIYLETDRRGEYSAFKPTMQSIMSSTGRKSVSDKL